MELERQVRAFDPWPGSATSWDGKRLEVLDAEVLDAKIGPAEGGRLGEAIPGHVQLAGRGAGVVTGDGLLLLRRVKLEGRPAMAIDDFLRGHREMVGAVLPS